MRKGTETRFQLGTVYTSDFNVPPAEAYNYKSLPPRVDKPVTKTLTSQLFPVLPATVYDVREKLYNHLDALAQQLQVEAEKTRFIDSTDEISLWNALCELGILFTGPEMALLLKLGGSPDTFGRLKIETLINNIAADPASLTSDARLAATAPPPLPEAFFWPDGQEFEVTLTKRPRHPSYIVPAAKMAELAVLATKLLREIKDAGELRDRLAYLMLQDMVVKGSRPEGKGVGLAATWSNSLRHADLSFKDWLLSAGVISLHETQQVVSGPFPPEVYEIFDQIIYNGLGVPKYTLRQTTLFGNGPAM